MRTSGASCSPSPARAPTSPGSPTRAVRDGDEWIVNGQKVWTTLAHVSELRDAARPHRPRRPQAQGPRYFVLDMHAPGVEVRPLYQITGEAEFNEVFLTDVRIPTPSASAPRARAGSVATTTLMNERVALGGGPAPQGAGIIGELVRAVGTPPGTHLDGAERAVWRDRVARLWVDAEIVRLTNAARASSAAVGGNPGPEGSSPSSASAELSQAV